MQTVIHPGNSSYLDNITYLSAVRTFDLPLQWNSLIKRALAGKAVVEWLRRWALELKVLSSSLPPATKFLGSFSDDGCVRSLKISVDFPARKEQDRAMPSGNSS